MLSRIIEKLRKDFRNSYESIKLPQVEERFDIYFSRFFGYYLALVSKHIGLTPNQVSLLSLLFGLVAGVFFFFQDDVLLVLIACLLITISGLFDSADGQLARMTQTSSELGRKVDAIIDSAVFVFCYTGGAIYFLDSTYGWWILPLAALGGYLHSAKSAAYEFYKTEFLFYVLGSKDFRIPYIEEVKVDSKLNPLVGKMLYYLELDYIRKQAQFHGRKRAHREQFEAFSQSEDNKTFKEKYSAVNESILTWWALVCGTNVHRFALMGFSLFGRMDLYFIYAILTSAFMFPLLKEQGRMDARLVESMRKSAK